MIGVYAKKIDDVWFGVACDEHRVFGTSFASTENGALAGLLQGLPFNVPFQVFSEPSALAERVLAVVKSIYEDRDAAQNFPLATEHLPAYTRRVLETASAIPVGYVATYGSVAKAAGGGARAVGNVMARNPFAPIVPCHRVVSAAFGLGGYGGGLDMKHAFLVREKRGFTAPRSIQVGDGELQVFPVEFVLRKLKE
ncbi:methylated-DNA--[protein]-cysteine S-methyltransferase [Candidatus Bathyarchaeota archaeon A05DMB-2]|jgi:methylated-DNA-[protein]-cysteine S-methyltransferase|nr:methylated-DNA--[protein]-cysteine S-methyltransferase [Candidatus Bathyarchaeota archaeon A05DMB-2]